MLFRSGLLGDRPWQQHLSLDGAKSEGGIGKLWARRKIEALVDSQRGTGDPASRDAVVAVALEHSLVSKFTALVALDKTPVRPADQDLKQAAVAANLPEGWVHDAVFGEMPQTATPAQWHALIGMIALAFALLCLMPLRRRVAA